MQRRIFRTGNSIVVSLPREALDVLGVSEGADVSLELDREEHRLIITVAEPAAPAGIDAAFAQQVSSFIERYRPALETLAK